MAQELQEEVFQPTPAGSELNGQLYSWKFSFWGRFLRQKAGVLGLFLLLMLLLTAACADFIAPGDPFSISREVLQPPSASHPFGTDDFGRDIFRAVVHGTRVSLLVGLFSAFTAFLIGVGVGGVA